MNRGMRNNLIPNKRGAPKRKMCCPRTGTHTVADMNMKEEDGILELGSGSSVSGEGSCRYIPG